MIVLEHWRKHQNTLRPAGVFFLEMALLFGLAWTIDNMLFSGAVGPVIYWGPIVVTAVLHGVPGGLAAAFFATLLAIAGGLPERGMEQSFYDYWAIVLVQPAVWFAAGAGIGVLRTRQAQRERMIRNDLATAESRVQTLADALGRSLQRTGGLERRIAVETRTVSALLSILPGLKSQPSQEILAELTPFLTRCAHALRIGVYTEADGVYRKVEGHGPLSLSGMNVAVDTLSGDDEPPFSVLIRSDDSAQAHGLIVVHKFADGVDRQACEAALTQISVSLAECLDQTAPQRSRPINQQGEPHHAG